MHSLGCQLIFPRSADGRRTMPALRRLRQDHRPVCLPCVVMRSISLHCRANRTARQEARGHDPVGGAAYRNWENRFRDGS